MLVHQRTRVWRKAQHVARVPHRKSQRASLASVESAEIDRHEKRGELIIRNFAGRARRNGLLDLLCGECFSVPFGFDERKKMHRRKLSNDTAKAMRKESGSSVERPLPRIGTNFESS